MSAVASELPILVHDASIDADSDEEESRLLDEAAADFDTEAAPPELLDRFLAQDDVLQAITDYLPADSRCPLTCWALYNAFTRTLRVRARAALARSGVGVAAAGAVESAVFDGCGGRAWPPGAYSVRVREITLALISNIALRRALLGTIPPGRLRQTSGAASPLTPEAASKALAGRARALVRAPARSLAPAGMIAQDARWRAEALAARVRPPPRGARRGVFLCTVCGGCEQDARILRRAGATDVSKATREVLVCLGCGGDGPFVTIARPGEGEVAALATASSFVPPVAATAARQPTTHRMTEDDRAMALALQRSMDDTRSSGESVAAAAAGLFGSATRSAPCEVVHDSAVLAGEGNGLMMTSSSEMAANQEESLQPAPCKRARVGTS